MLLLESTIVVNAASEHKVWEDGVATPTGSGLTVTVTVNVPPVHPAALTGVIVYTTSTLADVVLV